MNLRFFLAVAALALSGPLHAELVLITHPGSGLSYLSQGQVSRLFLGQTDRLPNGSRVTTLTVAGATREQFVREILGKTPQQIDKYWARMIFTGKATPPREVSAADIRKVVAQTPDAISYLDRSLVDDSVKVITLTAD